MLVGAFLPPVGPPLRNPFQDASANPEHEFYLRMSDDNKHLMQKYTYWLSSIDQAIERQHPWGYLDQSPIWHQQGPVER